MLIPHPDEHDDPLRLDYVRLRRDYAHSFAQSALEAVEVDAELLDSTNDPANVLSGESPMRLDRESFHPKVPVSLESVLALNLLSVYEYAQRGNMGKMRNRAGQALTAAMSLSLHESLEVDEFTEARRRAWWMTVCLILGSKSLADCGLVCYCMPRVDREQHGVYFATENRPKCIVNGSFFLLASSV